MDMSEANITLKSHSASCHDSSVIMTIPQEYHTLYVVSAVLNGVFALVAFLGNGLILSALTKASTLHPPARALYFSLALSDLGVGLVVQPLFVAYVVGGLVSKPALRCYARIAFGFASDYVIAVSYLTMTAVSLDRFFALHLLLTYRTTVTLRRTVVAVVISWIFCLVFPLVRAFYSTSLSLLTNLSGFTICLVISSIANLKIYRRLQRHKIELSNSPCLSLAQYKRSVNMVLIVYCAHLLCYLPSMGLTIFLIVVRPTEWLIVLANFVGTLLLSNSALNPFLYCWRARAVRQPAVDILVKIFCCLCE